MAGYTITGPFVNGSAPGISATFLNNIENWIQQLEGDAGSLSVSGGTSGTVTLYQVLQGTFKLVFVYHNNFADPGTKSITLPVAFTVGAFVACNAIGNVQLKTGGSGGTAQQFDILTTLASGGGSTSAATTLHDNSVAWCQRVFDTYVITTGGAKTGVVFIAGI